MSRLRFTLFSFAFAFLQFAAGQGAWEMRVCAEPHNLPTSGREEPGFNNRIAAILAEELNADLTYEWTPFDDQRVRRTLLAGSCDLIVGIAEDAAGTLSTVPYLRAPYVFVWRGEGPAPVETLDSEALRDLRIGTYQTGIASIALRNRGLEGNLVEFPPVGSAGGADRDTPILDALVAGEVDVAIVYGPEAAARAAREPGVLSFAPVQPELDVGASLLQFFRTWTIGVRPNDEALRDRLNLALAARWDEVQEAIASYGVPQLGLSRPPRAQEEVEDAGIRVGVVAPLATGGSVPLEAVGEPVRLGVETAENAMARRPGADATDVRVLLASAPTDAAAVRAAERLVATENADALVGGFGVEQAEALGRIAEEGGAVFFNVGSIDDRLRNTTCRSTSFHVQASAAMYVDAAIRWFTEQGHRDWFVVHEDTDVGSELRERALRAIDAAGGDVAAVGSVAVAPESLIFLEAFRPMRQAEPDAVLLLLEPDAQEMFLSQYGTSDLEAPVIGLPFPLAQTREYMFRFRDVGGDAGASPRPALWDASLAEGGAGELNANYLSRGGVPMEGTAWATYASIMIVFDAAQAGAAEDPSAMIEYLTAQEREFAVGKEGVSFRAWNHQLRQPLYIVAPDPDTTWTRSGRNRVDFGRVLARVPASSNDAPSVADLDRLGDDAGDTGCRF